MTDSEYKFNNECLLPPLGWDLKLGNEIVSISFPNKNNYIFYKITNFNYSYSKFDSKDNLIVDKFDCGYIPFSEKFLVAINEKKILFVSGMFFKDPISQFFKLDKKNPSTFLNFLNIKLFNYNIHKIVFKKSKRKKIIFEGFISSTNETVNIEIDSQNFDNIKVFYNNIKGYISLK